MKNTSLTILSISLSIVMLSGCSKDTNFTKEVRGTDEYLYTPSPQQLSIPPSIALPPQNANYEIPLPAKEGSLGLEIDITPPNVGLTSVDTQEQSKFVQEEYSSGLYQTEITATGGTDETSLPVIILNINFLQAWQKLADSLEKIGFEIVEQNQTVGSLKVEFTGLSSAEQESLGVVDFQLPRGVYLLQVGDLNTNTSIQFRNEQNSYVSQAQNDAIAQLLQRTLN